MQLCKRGFLELTLQFLFSLFTVRCLKLKCSLSLSPAMYHLSPSLFPLIVVKRCTLPLASTAKISIVKEPQGHIPRALTQQPPDSRTQRGMGDERDLTEPLPRQRKNLVMWETFTSFTIHRMCLHNSGASVEPSKGLQDARGTLSWRTENSRFFCYWSK